MGDVGKAVLSVMRKRGYVTCGEDGLINCDFESYYRLIGISRNLWKEIEE